MFDSATREWQFYLDDMIEFAEKVILYTDGLDQERFVTSGLNYDATVRNLELVGEAAGNVPDAIRQQYSSIPWRMVVATRNKLIHGYLGIDNDILWNIIQSDIPTLLLELQKMKLSLESEGGAEKKS